MGSMEPLNIFVLVCFGPLLYIQVELGWKSNFFCKTKEVSFATTPTTPSPKALFLRLISLTDSESNHTDFLNSSAPDGFCSALHK